MHEHPWVHGQCLLPPGQDVASMAAGSRRGLGSRHSQHRLLQVLRRGFQPRCNLSKHRGRFEHSTRPANTLQELIPLESSFTL